MEVSWAGGGKELVWGILFLKREGHPSLLLPLPLPLSSLPLHTFTMVKNGTPVGSQGEKQRGSQGAKTPAKKPAKKAPAKKKLPKGPKQKKYDKNGNVRPRRCPRPKIPETLSHRPFRVAVRSLCW
jgi:hypothetical protein